jgi:hypothetical protein
MYCVTSSRKVCISATLEVVEKDWLTIWIVHIDALPGNLIGCHDYRDPTVIKINSQIFYTIEKGVKEGKCVSHLAWLVLHVFVHEFSHYLAEKACSFFPFLS